MGAGARVDHGTWSVEAAREADRRGRVIDVLVTVKASPQPSMRYGETVCVAGIAPSPARLVRLYPVPFRYLDGDQQFHKYEILHVKVRDAGSDKRPESLRIDAHSLTRSPVVKGWKRRAPFVEPLIGGALCELQAATKVDINARSLAVIEPDEFTGLKISRHPGWTQEQLEKFDKFAAQGDLFRTREPHLLAAPRFVVKLCFRCRAPKCDGHEPSIIDWELTALQYNLRSCTDAELTDAIQDRFGARMFNSGTAPAIFLGNQANPARRSQFMVLGVYYPKAGDAGGTLF